MTYDLLSVASKDNFKSGRTLQCLNIYNLCFLSLLRSVKTGYIE